MGTGRGIAGARPLRATMASIVTGTVAGVTLAGAAAPAFPAEPAHAASNDETATTPADPQALSQSFAERFAPFAGPPAPLSLDPGAVDLDSFDPPRGPQVIRALGTGVASYYGRRFHGRRTANGERFDMNAMTAAHKTLPFGTFVQVTNPANGRQVTVRINDRGPFTRGRTIDLSRAAASKLGIIRRGHGRVRLDIVSP